MHITLQIMSVQRKRRHHTIDYTKAGYTRKLDRDCYLKYDAIFPIGEDVKQQFLKVYPECAGRTKVFIILSIQRK